jgi:Fe2+ transport protein
MLRIRNLKRAAMRGAPVLATVLLLAGCAAADKTAPTSTTAAAASGSSGSSGGMAGMNMGTTASAASSEASAAGVAVDGIKPVPTQILGSAVWQGMKITAQAMTAVPFVIYNGTTEQLVKPTSKTSFHLMVLLNDAQTNVPIPYASVWATITKDGKIDFDERQWPMISRYMGPHYGNDVALPGAGEYQLSLLVSPPVSARHVEYENVWLKPHRVNFTFHWAATS